jgi:hypothetical protein
VKGWRALTNTWERPIQPGPVQERAPRLPAARGRKPLLSREARRRLFELDRQALQAEARIADLFERNNITDEQRGHQRLSVRRSPPV